MEAHLTEMVKYLAAQSWQIAVLTVAVAAVTFALRHRSAHVRYLLWLIVVAKCLVPPLHVAPLRVLPPVIERTPVLERTPARNADPSPIPSPILPDTLRALNEALSFPVERGLDSRPSASVTVLLSPVGRAAAILWLIGAGSYLAMNLLRALRGHCWLRKSRRLLAEEVRADTPDLLRAYGVRRLPRVYIVDGVSQPFVWGLVRGNIYVPPSFLAMESPEHRRDILAHELSHVLRFDAAVNALQIIAQSLFWFHPFVWWANRRIRQEREKCCDEMVIARLHTLPKDYSTAIVETLARAGKSDRSVPSLAVASPVRHIEGRIRAILRPGKRFHARPSLPVVTLVILAALAAVPTTLVVTALTLEPIALSVPLAEFPHVLNGWTGADLEIPTTVQEYMRANFADDFINRRYTNEATQEWADLYVVYCSSRPGAILGHTPQVCFPANGWIHDGTTPSQITSRSGHSIDCLILRFHKASRPSDAMTVLCFYMVDGHIIASENDFPRHWAGGPSVSGGPARYVAQVEICSSREGFVRSAASSLADAILDSLPDPDGRLRAMQSGEPRLMRRADGSSQSVDETSANDDESKQLRFAARTFNSDVAFDVFVQESPGSVLLGISPDAGTRLIGHTPSAAPLEIPPCWLWGVASPGPVKDWDSLVGELRRNGVPALLLPSITDSDLNHVAKLKDLRVFVSYGAPITDAGLAVLAGMPQLQTLGLHDTRITDAGLTQLRRLPKLQEVLLVGSQVTDAGLAELKTLAGLRELGLPGAQITDAGMVHLRELAGLERLDLPGTKITDAGLANLKGMTGLRRLNVSNTQITDAGMATLKGLTGLQWLGLGGLTITNVGLDCLRDLNDLRWLELSGSGITEEGLAGITNLTRLQGLGLTGVRITDAGLTHLAGLVDLRALNLRNAEVTDAGLEHLKGLTELRKLEFYRAPITDAGLIHLRGMTHLQELSLVGAKVAGPGMEHLKGLIELERLDLQINPITDAGLANLEGLTALKTLYVSYSQVTDAGLQHIRNLTRLEQLSLHDAVVTDVGLEHLKDMTALRWLGLSNNRITGSGLKHLQRMTRLESLSLDGNPISGRGLGHLKNLSSLRRLDLRNSGITHVGMEELKGLIGLQELSLSLDSSSMTDAELVHLKDLAGLRLLDLSNSQITDGGLAHLEGMTGLERLDLRSTRITDAGLEHVGNMTQLSYLNLYGTEVTDAGLAHLKSLDTLGHLSVRHTRITGAGIAHLKDLSRLSCLDLCGIRFTDADIEHVRGIAALSSLRLYDTQITDAGLERIKDLTRLEELWLGHTGITDSGMQNLTGLKRLRNLDLRGTRITDAGLEYLKDLDSLGTVSLFGTQVTAAAQERLRQSHPNLAIDMRE